MNVDDAVADEHVRSAVYRRVVEATADAASREDDRVVVATILRDPVESVSRTAVVDLVDRIATGATDAAWFRRWAAELQPVLDELRSEGNREFLRRRVRDRVFWLSIKDGRTPVPADLGDVTDWMQRLLADESTSLPVLTEHGSTRKIRNVAKHRAGRGQQP
ncbi:hypothetical protein [Actinophytocola xinjiangensis]|uniref:hypothetical protein n=1 Tax=Actinophytocola xinjiangensis TaxID=485602 RepID=UPI001FEC8644|nr:hypothetical protein [Actinophytocola xinjiangensis]